MTQSVLHQDISPRLLSPKIWGNLPITRWAIRDGGRFFIDDFDGQASPTDLTFGAAHTDSSGGTANVNDTIVDVPATYAEATLAAQLATIAKWIKDGQAALSPYKVFADTDAASTTLKQVTIKQNTDEFGVLEVAGNVTDNHASIIQLATLGGSARLDDDDEFRTAFECRIKKASIGNNALAFFIGLAQVSKATATGDILTTDNADLTDIDYIGFHVDQAAGNTLDFVFRKSGQAAQIKIAGVKTLVADTYVKLGFKLDPNNPADKRIKVYVDNTEQGTYVTQTNMEAATFPDDVALAMTFATKVGTAAESKAQLDWWAYGQAE